MKYTCLMLVSVSTIGLGAAQARVQPYAGVSVSVSHDTQKGSIEEREFISGGRNSIGRKSKTMLYDLGLLAGARYFINDTYFIGGEISGDMNVAGKQSATKKWDSEILNYRYTLKRKFSIIPSLAFGAKLSDACLSYVKVGLNLSQYKFEGKGDFDDSPYVTKTKMLKGVQFAVGGEYLVSKEQGLSIRGEVGYTRFPKQKIVNKNLPDAEAHYKAQPSSVNVKFALVKTF